MPEKFALKAEGLSVDQAAMVEFLAIGAHATTRVKLRVGEKVLVVGIGPIGLAVAVFARLAGTNVTLIETTLLGSRNATREDFRRVMDALRAGEVPDALITHRLSFEDVPAGFASLADPAAGVVKAMVEFA